MRRACSKRQVLNPIIEDHEGSAAAAADDDHCAFWNKHGTLFRFLLVSIIMSVYGRGKERG